VTKLQQWLIDWLMPRSSTEATSLGKS